MKHDDLIQAIRDIAMTNGKVAQVLAHIADVEKEVANVEQAHQKNIGKAGRSGYERGDRRNR